jgi:uncharacterized OB-fold protein
MPEPLPTPAPDINPETETFWRATTEGRLLLAVCDECGTAIWYPRAFCPACHSHAVSWTEASGDGVVFTFTVVHRSMGAFREAAPYVIAYVELAEGPRVLTNIVGCEPDDVFIGQAVHVVFADTGQGSALYRFEPTAP